MLLRRQYTLNSRFFKYFQAYSGKYFRREMGTFVTELNPVTGKQEWTFHDEKYDYKQEIARSAYADMLHDTERNQKYYSALAKAISKHQKEGKPAHVLDIGTGTGLLSMMAARLGAHQVTACEAFEPVANCARQILNQNGFQDKVHLIPKRSTDVKVGNGKDMESRADILVTEVFDTELIGEGAIQTFTHAHQQLLKPDCTVIPAAGNLYIQLASSKLVSRWNQVPPIQVPGYEAIISPEKISSCGGAPSLHDLQLDQLPLSAFTPLTVPLKVFRFDFSGKTVLRPDESVGTVVKSLNAGQVDAIFMWWDLEMDEEGEIILSCAPRWAHPTPSHMQWRDHWMQAIYYPYNNITVKENEELKVISSHDEYSFWFDVSKETSEERTDGIKDRPVCTCGAHITHSRSRLAMVSDPYRLDIYIKTLQQNITPDSVCLCISDGGLLPLIAARHGAKQVFALESNHQCSRFVMDFVKQNNLQDRVTVLCKRPEEVTTQDLCGLKVSVILAEPVFQSSVLPWDHIYFWYAIDELREHMTRDCKILPKSMSIKTVAVDYTDLWKIRAPVGICEGFDLKIFDDLIQETIEKVDAHVEPQPLWEYPCRALSMELEALNLDFTSCVRDHENFTTELTMKIESQSHCNGVVVWSEFDFGDALVLSTGPKEPVVLDKKIEWDMYTRQGVHFLQNSEKEDAHKQDKFIRVKVDFKPSNGNVSLGFTRT
ncbi:hypothetical protein ACJMK2_010353 [Sinanodonta woodiana]|uniref:Protein arginine N-methyltransferase n=1 Tax=Sinanodonta woodiana TaxID=1069815 RepID=A0ABD3VF27_SINWO